jgi:serine/threonine protein kinase
MFGVVQDHFGDLTMIVMELATCTLQDYCRLWVRQDIPQERGGVPFVRPSITVEMLWQMFCGAVRGLKYLHEQLPPVYHRDLKDTNLFLFLDGAGCPTSIKIGDFGDAKVRCTCRWPTLLQGQCSLQHFWCVASCLLQRTARSELHRPGAGNSFTKAPEAFLGILSSKTDTYAIGVTFAQAVVMTIPMMTDDAVPLRAETHYGTTYDVPALLADARARLMSHRSELAANFARVLGGCCQAEADARLDSTEVVACVDDHLAPGAAGRATSSTALSFLSAPPAESVGNSTLLHFAAF